MKQVVSAVSGCCLLLLQTVSSSFRLSLTSVILLLQQSAFCFVSAAVAGQVQYCKSNLLWSALTIATIFLEKSQ